MVTPFRGHGTGTSFPAHLKAPPWAILPAAILRGKTLLSLVAALPRRRAAHERDDARPVRPRAGRPPRRRATLAATVVSRECPRARFGETNSVIVSAFRGQLTTAVSPNVRKAPP